MMWIILFLVTLIRLSTNQAGANTVNCEDIHNKCYEANVSWICCYESRIQTCTTRQVRGPPRYPLFIRQMADSSKEFEVRPTQEHNVYIPSSALQRGRGGVSEEEIMVVTTVIDSTHFKLAPQRSGRGRGLIHREPARVEGSVMGELVLVVKAGNQPMENLAQSIKLTFKYDKQVGNGTCVYWHMSEPVNGTGYWSPDGCDTDNTGSEFVCSCNHLSFFAVLVNPVISVDESSSTKLSYITYIGSALSVLFTVISLIIYICLQRRRPEKAISVHMQLTGALLCLHLSFLLCSFWAWRLDKNEGDWVCQALGLFLHWSLLASLSWMALEGFHLYLLLVRVFNIYVRRYVLKLSLVGWGVPTLIAAICGISGVYGKYSLRHTNNHNSTAQMCWISNQKLVVSYITTVAFPCLVILYNSCMLGVVIFKLWVLKGGCGGFENNSSWKKMSKEKGSRLWKDCATVLGLSCVLGLPWGLAGTTYISLPGIYIFTILNSLQGVFMFLWSMALICKSQPDNNSSVRDPSSQKMMTTSFNN